MKTYKGFNKDMTCKGFQYKEGETYETKEAKCCETGFHGCEYPLDCFNYYYPAKSEFHEVEQTGRIDKHGEDTKISSTKIKIGAKLSITGLVKAAIDFTMARTRTEAKSDEDSGAASSTEDHGAASSTGIRGSASSTGYCGAASSTGYCGAASSTGNRGAASSTGYYSAAFSTGDHGAASSTGIRGSASSTGYCGAASSTGRGGVASSTGIRGSASSTGEFSAAFSTGDHGAASSGHETSVAVAWGYHGKGKGVLGSYIVLADWRNISGGKSSWKASDWKFKGAKMIRIDGKRYKPDTWYSFDGNGKIVEVKENE